MACLGEHIEINPLCAELIKRTDSMIRLGDTKADARPSSSSPHRLLCVINSHPWVLSRHTLGKQGTEDSIGFQVAKLKLSVDLRSDSVGPPALPPPARRPMTGQEGWGNIMLILCGGEDLISSYSSPWPLLLLLVCNFIVLPLSGDYCPAPWRVSKWWGRGWGSYKWKWNDPGWL